MTTPRPALAVGRAPALFGVRLAALVSFTGCAGPAAAAPGKPVGPILELLSPDGRTRVVLTLSEHLRWAVERDGKPVLLPSRIGLAVRGRAALGERPRVRTTSRAQVDKTFSAPLYARRAEVRDHHKALTIWLHDGLGITFRAYDDAVAYRLHTRLAGELIIDDERAEWRFPGEPTAHLGIEPCKPPPAEPDCFHSSYERNYTELPLARWPEKGDTMAYLPALVSLGDGRPRVLLTEADLRDYPGLWLRPARDGSASASGVFARYPSEEKLSPGRYPSAWAVTRTDFIARTTGTRDYPWRLLLLADRDIDLPGSDVVYRLGGDTPAEDFSWVRPGKSTSEWLWANELYGVDFVAGYNTATYAHYLDFARAFGLEYLFFDAGWSDFKDLSRMTPEMDMDGLIRRARDANLGVVLWTTGVALRGRVAPELDRLARLGATGVMIDFLERDDQPMVNFYEEILTEAARRKLIVNFHGAFKPTGIERRFPNAVTREALVAFEYNKWGEEAHPAHEVLLPYIRGVAGGMDYEPGAMRNAAKDRFQAMGKHPMSQGTRAHQAALLVLYDSVYAKLGGNVSDYRREPEYTRFLVAIPTVWRQTRVLYGKLGEFIVTLREARNGELWLAAITDWTARTLTIPLTFLGTGPYQADLVRDGLNAHTFGHDHVREQRVLRAGDSLTLPLAPGGGFVARIRRAPENG